MTPSVKLGDEKGYRRMNAGEIIFPGDQFQVLADPRHEWITVEKRQHTTKAPTFNGTLVWRREIAHAE